MQRKLTDVKIRNAKPKPDGKVNKLTDGGGLCLQVEKAGKYWRYNYRYIGKQKTLAIGTYPEVGLSLARERHIEARAMLANGVDPSAFKQAEKQKEVILDKNTFSAVSLEWVTKFSENWTVAYKNKVANYLEKDINPFIGSRPIAEIEPPEVLAVCERVSSRGALYTAHLVKQLCGQVFRYGVATGKCKRDTAADLKGALPTPKTNNFPTITNPVQVGELLRAIDSYEGNFITRTALSLLPYLFCRPGELRHMEWPELDLDIGVWSVPEGKMKSRRLHRVPLSKQAIALILEIEPLTGSSKYVFHGLRSGSVPMSENTFNAALRKLGYSKDEMVSHGFRGMASSLLNEQGWNPDAIEAQLAHVQGDKVRAAYNRAQYWDERVKMMQHYSDYLDGLRSGADVIPIGKKTSLNTY